MKPDTLDWTPCRTFLHILEGGSLSAAARHLGFSHVTVRRHLEALEGVLGGPLFTRSPTGLLATDLAHRIAPAARSMAAAAASLTRTATTDQEAIGGTVRIAASEVVGGEVLPPMLMELRRAHPALRFELALSDVPEDILRRDADVAVRMMEPTQASLVARRVGSVPLGLYAEARWIDANGLPADAAALLATRALIGQDRRTEYLAALAACGVGASRHHLGFASDSALAQLAALRAGLGIGVMQVPMACRAPSLVRVLPEIEFALEMWLVTHPDLRHAARIRVVMEALASELQGYLQGRRNTRTRGRDRPPQPGTTTFPPGPILLQP